MKRFLLFAAALAVLVACDKNEEEKNTEQKIVETHKIDAGATLKHMVFDSVHVAKTEDKLKELCDLNGIRVPQVDFSRGCVLSVAGIAPAIAESIDATLKKTAGKYLLDIDIKVSESEYVKPRVWSTMLQAPADVPQQIECRISYDMQFDSNQRPDSSFIFNIGSEKPSQLMPLVDLSGAYGVIIRENDMEKLKGAVNDDEKCIMTRYGSDSYGRFVSSGIIESYIQNKYVATSAEAGPYCMVFLKDCNYDKIIAPLEDVILYAGHPITYCSGDTGMPSIAFEWPYTYVRTIEGNESALKNLARALQLHISSENGMTAFNIYKKSKINVLQLKYLLASEGYINTSTSYLTFPYIWKETFDSAKKEIIFD